MRAHLERSLNAARAGIALSALLYALLAFTSLAVLTHTLFGIFTLPSGLERTASAFAALAIAIVIYLILGVQLPRLLAGANPDRWALITANPLNAWIILSLPLVRGSLSLAKRSAHLLGVPMASLDDNRVHDEAELQLLLSAAESGGELDAVEQDLASRSLGLGDIRLEEIMTPRVAIEALSEDTSQAEAQKMAIAAGADWLPVYVGSPDQIHGIVTWQGIFAASKQRPWQANIQKAIFLPEGASASAALARLRDEGAEVAVVLDEYGGTSGLINIRALYDELARVEWIPSPNMDINGRLPLRVVAQTLKVELDNAGPVTIGGFVVGRLGRFARVGDEVAIDGWRIRVMSVDKRIGVVQTVRLLRPEERV